MMKIREGYKETEIGVIPEDWEVDKIANIVINTQLGVNEKSSEKNEGIPLIKMGNLTIGGFSFSKLEMINDDNLENYYDYVLKYGDFLFNTRNTPELVGKSATWKYNDNSTIFNSNIMRIVFSNTIDTFWMNYYFASKAGWKSLKKISTGTTSVGAIYTKDLIQVKLPIPPITEQQRIAEILSKIDEHIEKLYKTIEDYQLLKKGMMKKLLTEGIGHTEFKETEIGRIPKKWEVKELGNVICIRSGSSPSKFILSEAGNYPFFKVDDMNYTNKYLKEAKVFFNETRYPLMERGMVVFPKRGASIFTNKVAILEIDGFFDTNVMGLSVKDGLIAEFLFYLLKYIGLQQFADTTAIPQINNKHILPLKISLPSEQEQINITLILSNIDNRIDLYQQEQQDFIQLKKVLMEKLLTGKIRTI